MQRCRLGRNAGLLMLRLSTAYVPHERRLSREGVPLDIRCLGSTGRYLMDQPRRREHSRMSSQVFKPLCRAPWRLAGFLAVGLSASLGLSGCADDALLMRDASPVHMPVATMPSAGQALGQAVADETGTNSLPAGQGQAKPYFAAIGRVVLQNHAGDDFWSAPDIFVQVQRRDPDILQSIRVSRERVAALGEQMRAVQEELRPLRLKQQESEKTPGEPLSPTQVDRLDELSRDPGDACDDPSRRASCNQCSRYDERPECVECEACNELRFLREKKAASEIVPGPELTPQEREQLQELEGTAARISGDRREAEREIRRLRDAITGHTHTITTPGYVLDFGYRPIQAVLPGDEVWIWVYDRDTGANDLYGSTTLRIGDALLRGDDVELAMPNVRSLILRIVSP